MTRATSKEWGPNTANVTGVACGPTPTRQAQALGGNDAHIQVGDNEIPIGVHQDNLAMLNSVIPLGRTGTPEEAAGAVYMFCIPESNYVSGQVIVCGGGLRT